MPNSGFCNVCYGRVWLTEDGSCEHGHAPFAISDVRETPEGSPWAPGGTEALPPTVTVIQPPNLDAGSADLSVPSAEIPLPEDFDEYEEEMAEASPAPPVPPATPGDALSASAERLISIARARTSGTRAVTAQGRKALRPMIVAVLVATAVLCCCCSSPFLALFGGDDSIQSTDSSVQPAFPPSEVVTDAVDPDSLTLPLLPADTTTPSAGSTAGADATDTAAAAAAYQVVIYPSAPWTLRDVFLGATDVPDADPVAVESDLSAASTADITVSFVVPEGVPDSVMFSGDLYSTADGAPPDGIATAGPASLDPGTAIARFGQPDGGWDTFTVYEVRLLADDEQLASVFFALTD